MSAEAVATDGPFFLEQGHERFVWLAEGSYDQSTFYPAESPDEVADRRQDAVDRTKIEQFEVENKYRPLEKGTVFMDGFQSALQRTFQGRAVVESKYATAIDALYPRR
jgi:hypothetical protein